MPLRIARVLLPPAAIAIFVLTLKTCFHVAREAGHLDVYDEMGWLPVISFFGDDDPERTIFRRGFTALAIVLALLLTLRSIQLARDPSLRTAWLRRGSAAFVSVLGVVALLMMTWIPDNVSPVHFFAALATFFFLSVREVLESTLAVTAFRKRGFRAVHALQLLWGFACPIASVVYVVKWITTQSVEAQYVAVGLQFAYFLGAMPELARATPAEA